ncbi:MAG: SRPBCC domain-containing protein, partial [Desulfobulbia bacterium]
MELKGEKRITASREKVYEALNDPAVLEQSIPGCQSLTKKSETEFEATVGIKIGPVKANFKGEVELTDLNPP